MNIKQEFALTFRSKDLDSVASLDKIKEDKNSTTKEQCQFLDLFDNNFNGLNSSFSGLLAYTRLQSLSLQKNVLRGTWAESLVRHIPPTVRLLDISTNSLKSLPLEHLLKLRLFELICDDNQISRLNWNLNLPDESSASSTPLLSSLRSLSLRKNMLATLDGVDLMSNLGARNFSLF
jgi:Leucine-rich repeat (LRR) protein